MRKRKDGFLLKGYEDLVVIGISVCWGAKDAYFVSLQQELSDTGRKHVIVNFLTNFNELAPLNASKPNAILVF